MTRSWVGKLLLAGALCSGACSSETDSAPVAGVNPWVEPSPAAPVGVAAPPVGAAGSPSTMAMGTAGAGAVGTPPSGAGGSGASMTAGGTGGMAGSAGTGGSGTVDPPVMMPGMTIAGDEVPATPHCEPVANWDPKWTMWEDEVLRLTNEARAVGHNCDTKGNFGPAPPLTTNANLRCSARLHSQDMGMKGFFEHTNLDGKDPFVRMGEAGYVGFTMGENIAKGQQSPAEVVAGWLDSDGHCSNIMNKDYKVLGVGFWQGPPDNQFYNGNLLWTQNFGG